MALRSGPTTKDFKNILLAEIDIRAVLDWNYGGDEGAAKVENQLANYAKPALSKSFSIGKMTATGFNGSPEYYESFSGSPKLRDGVIPLSANAQLTGNFHEINLQNLRFATGLSNVLEAGEEDHVGFFGLGKLAVPEMFRVEGWITFPDQVSTMVIMFPRAQVMSDFSIAGNSEDEVNVPVTISSVATDSSSAGMLATSTAWDDAPLGGFMFAKTAYTTSIAATTVAAALTADNLLVPDNADTV